MRAQAVEPMELMDAVRPVPAAGPTAGMDPLMAFQLGSIIGPALANAAGGKEKRKKAVGQGLNALGFLLVNKAMAGRRPPFAGRDALPQSRTRPSPLDTWRDLMHEASVRAADYGNKPVDYTRTQ